MAILFFFSIIYLWWVKEGAWTRITGVCLGLCEAARIGRCKGQFGAARGTGSPLAGPKAGRVLLKAALQMDTVHLSSTPLQPLLASAPAVRDKAR